MRITITARHCDVPSELRDRARHLLDRLSKVAPRPHDAQVIFGADHGTPMVELRLHTARGVPRDLREHARRPGAAWGAA